MSSNLVHDDGGPKPPPNNDVGAYGLISAAATCLPCLIAETINGFVKIQASSMMRETMILRRSVVL